MTENLFAVYRIPNHPKGEWTSGVEVQGAFYAALSFATCREAIADARAMNDALRANPRIADELRKLVCRRP
jgi:hypothetical protein